MVAALPISNNDIYAISRVRGAAPERQVAFFIMGRKAFKFYRSYYDVAMELSDKDFVSFMKALLNRQFNGFETELTGMAKFAYLSQKHSIDAQVEGFEAKTGVALCNEGAMQGGSEGDIKGAIVQEKEKEKVQEQEKEKGEVLAAHAAHINYKKQSEMDFINEMRNFEQLYSRDMLNTFYQYWSEKDAKGMMRFQREKTWELDKRLMRWKSKQKEYGKSGAKSSVNDFIEKIQTIKTNL